jgi:hypothetical protein
MPEEQDVTTLFWVSSILFLISGVGQQLLWNEFNLNGAGKHTENGLDVFSNYVGSVILVMFMPSVLRQFQWKHWYYMVPNAAMDLVGTNFSLFLKFRFEIPDISSEQNCRVL